MFVRSMFFPLFGGSLPFMVSFVIEFIWLANPRRLKPPVAFC